MVVDRFCLSLGLAAVVLTSPPLSAMPDELGCCPGSDRAAALRDGVFTDRVVVRCVSGVHAGDLAGCIGSKIASVEGLPEWGAFARAWKVRAVRPTFCPAPRNARLSAELGMDRFCTIAVDEGTDVEAMASDARRLVRLFEHVEVERNGFLTTAPVNDPLFVQQWALSNSGQSVNGQAGAVGADVHGVGAWAYMVRRAPVVVAVLDTGVAGGHPDLQSDLVPGRNFANSSTPTLTDDEPSLSHGTYCAGIIAATQNNSLGVAGIAPNARIMPVKVMQILGGLPFGSQTTCANGLTWAVDNGARVASLSLGWDNSSSTGALATAIDYAAAQDVVVCASTGNTPGAAVGYPARFSKVLSVGGSDALDRGWVGGTTGPEMKVVAPADNILTTSNDTSGLNSYSLQTGTSMSCPIAAGIVAMVRGEAPSLTAAQVVGILTASADDLGAPGWDQTYGYGRVNALRAVQMAHRMACPPDMDGSGRLDTLDIFAFLESFFLPDARADFDGDGTLTVADVFAFLSAWLQGDCP